MQVLAGELCEIVEALTMKCSALRRGRVVVLALAVSGCMATARTTMPASRTGPRAESASSYESTLEGIAQAIEGLKTEYPQLSEFSASTHCNGQWLRISYAYLTERAAPTGGWMSGVPHPTDHGVWFHIDIHNADSKAQIHTQPVVTRFRLRDRRVLFLLLDGAKTKSLYAPLTRILLAHGIQTVERR